MARSAAGKPRSAAWPRIPQTESEFAALAERHRPELQVHCYRMLGSFDGAEDAVQETFLRAWRARDTLERPEWFRAWLYKIATNTCLDEIKRTERHLERFDSIADVTWLQPYPDRMLELAAAPEGGPGEALVERETIELTFLAVIQLLPPPQRAVLILREMVGWSAKETGEVLELTVPAVNSALQRARATLREQLPSERRELWTTPQATAAERRALEGFIEAHERGDTRAALELIADDVRVTMPPNGLHFDGREAVVPLIVRAHSGADGEWRLVPTAANRHPAAASYLRAPGDDTFRAFKLDVLRVVERKIAELTTFGSDRFAAFGLSDVLPPEPVTDYRCLFRPRSSHGQANDARERAQGVRTMDFKYELTVVPVSDVDRAKEFYAEKLGFNVDVDHRAGEHFRVVQLTPPGSAASITIGTGMPQAEPGSYKGMHLVVDDLVAARDLLVGRGVDVSEPFHFGPKGQAEGMHPEKQSYGSFVTFDDPDGNNWLVQEVTERSPGLQ